MQEWGMIAPRQPRACMQPSNLRLDAYRSLPSDQDVFSLLISCTCIQTKYWVIKISTIIAIMKHQLANNNLFHKMWQAYHNAC